MPLESDIDALRSCENAIAEAVGGPKTHTVTGAFVYESWSLEALERERTRLSRRIAAKCGLTRTVSQGGH